MPDDTPEPFEIPILLPPPDFQVTFEGVFDPDVALDMVRRWFGCEPSKIVMRETPKGLVGDVTWPGYTDTTA